MALTALESQMLDNANSNLIWFQSNYSRLKKDFADKFIAIKDRNVIASADNTSELLEKLSKINVNSDHVLIKFVSKITMIL